MKNEIKSMIEDAESLAERLADLQDIESRLEAAEKRADAAEGMSADKVRQHAWELIAAMGRWQALMFKQLHANAHKGDRWKHDPVESLITRVEEELRQMQACYLDRHEAGTSPDEMDRRAANLANMAMMVADAFRERVR